MKRVYRVVELGEERREVVQVEVLVAERLLHGQLLVPHGEHAEAAGVLAQFSECALLEGCQHYKKCQNLCYSAIGQN